MFKRKSKIQESIKPEHTYGRRIIEIFSPKPEQGRPGSKFGAEAPALYIEEFYTDGELSEVGIYFYIIPGDYQVLEKQPFFREFRRFLSEYRIGTEEYVDYGDNIAQDRELSFVLPLPCWYKFSMQPFYPQLVEWVRSSAQRIGEIPKIPAPRICWQHL